MITPNIKPDKFFGDVTLLDDVIVRFPLVNVLSGTYFVFLFSIDQISSDQNQFWVYNGKIFGAKFQEIRRSSGVQKLRYVNVGDLGIGILEVNLPYFFLDLKS